MNNVIGFNKCFKAANQCKKRYRILYGSAGSGKSLNTARDYILKLSDMRYRGANLLCVRKSENSNLTSTYSELCKAIIDIFGGEHTKIWSIKANPMSMTCNITGNKIIFRGCNDANQIEKLKSVTFATGNLTWIWIEEATELLRNDIEILDDRLRGEFTNKNLYHQITMTFNPVSSSHWIKKVFFDVVSSDVFVHRSTYLDNKYIGAEYHARMERRKELDPEGYRIYGLGEWGETSGLVFTNWSITDVPQDNSWYDDNAYGQDFGFNHANAVLDLGIKDGDIYIKREIYVTEKDTGEIIEIAKDWDKTPIMYCDSAEPDRITTWRRSGFRAVECVKGKGSVKAQIDWLKQRKIYIDSSCVNTKREIDQYRWQKDRISGEYLDEPVVIFDDAMAALRYGVQNWRLRVKVEPKKADTRSDLEKYRDKRLKPRNKIKRSYY